MAETTVDPSATRELITACQDVFSMLPALPASFGTARRAALSHRVHVEIGTVVLREWLAFAGTDAMIIMVDELGARDDYMALLYKATGWLYTSSTFHVDDVSLPALSTALMQLRTLGVRFSAHLLSALLRTEMYGTPDDGASLPAGAFASASASASVPTLASTPGGIQAIADVMLELYGSTASSSGFDFGYSMFG